MSNAAKTSGMANARGGPIRSAPMTTAARKALEAQRAGASPFVPWHMPEVEVGEIVLYQSAGFNARQPSFAALVMQVNPVSLELAVFDKDLGMRLLPDAVRHKDDPEFDRLRRVNANEEERQELGVWFRGNTQFTPTERRRLKLLMEIYADELREFEESGTIHGKKPGDNGTGGDSAA
jgi:hypothetical protein